MYKVTSAVVVVGVVAGIAAAAILAGHSYLHSQADKGTYYRFKVALTYQAKPIDIDIVVGCGVHDAFNVGSGGSTSEVMSMTAYRFGWRTPDGHALVIHTAPSTNAPACFGNYDLPKEWLPLVVWYERDDDFAQGIAYATQDAYENPNARFGFRGARVEPADRADYEAYVKRGPKNILPPNLANKMVEPSDPHLYDKGVNLDELAKNPTSAWPYSGPPWCFGARRIRLTDSQRAKVHAMWPADRPKYWSQKTSKEEAESYYNLLTADQKWGGDLAKYFASPSDPERKEQPEIYPTLVGEGLAAINKDTPADDRYVHEILIDPALRGFKYCDEFAAPKLIEKVTHRKATPMIGNITCRVRNYTVPTGPIGCRQETRWVAFENDEYAIIAEQILI